MIARLLPFAAATAALASIGCSDAPARPARIGLSMTLRNPSSSVTQAANMSCPTTTGTEWNLGKATESGGIIEVDAPMRMDNPACPRQNCSGTRLEDGKSGANISCTVRKNGSFNSEGGGTDPAITKPNGSINFTMGGTAKKDGTAATNLINVAVYTPLTFSVSSNSNFPSCYITNVRDLDAGALWADFDCPALVATPNVACAATGSIVMEYCKTGEED